MEKMERERKIINLAIGISTRFCCERKMSRCSLPRPKSLMTSNFFPSGGLKYRKLLGLISPWRPQIRPCPLGPKTIAVVVDAFQSAGQLEKLFSHPNKLCLAAGHGAVGFPEVFEAPVVGISDLEGCEEGDEAFPEVADS